MGSLMLCANCGHSKESHRKEQVNAPRWDPKKGVHEERLITVYLNCNAQWCECQRHREEKT